MNNLFEHLEKRVVDWGYQRRLVNAGNFHAQIKKLREEVQELEDATHIDQIKDGIGDCMVVLTIIAAMFDLTLLDCYFFAYNQIKDRKGKTVNGVFIKET